MKYLAIDYGLKRVGIAVSDSGGSMAFARCTLNRDGRDAFFEELLKLIADERAEAIVVGLPLHLDGSESLTTSQVRNFVESLGRRITLPIYLEEEALSSAEAESMLKSAGYKLGHCARSKGAHAKAQKEQGRIDSLAAARILETFLDKVARQQKMNQQEMGLD